MRGSAARPGYRFAAFVAVLSLAVVGCSDDPEPIAQPAVPSATTEGTDPLVVPDVVPVPDAAPELTDDGLDDFVPVITYEILLSRDPFEPVREPPPAETPPGGVAIDPTSPGVPGGVTTPPGTFPGTSTGGSTGSGSGSGSGSSGGSSDGAGSGTAAGSTSDPSPCRTYGDVVCDGTSITLVDITTEDGEPVAIVEVNTTVLELTAGTSFFEWFRLLSIDGTCADFVYGDESFTLCEGDEVLK